MMKFCVYFLFFCVVSLHAFQPGEAIDDEDSVYYLFFTQAGRHTFTFSKSNPRLLTKVEFEAFQGEDKIERMEEMLKKLYGWMPISCCFYTDPDEVIIILGSMHDRGDGKYSNLVYSLNKETLNFEINKKYSKTVENDGCIKYTIVDGIKHFDLGGDREEKK